MHRARTTATPSRSDGSQHPRRTADPLDCSFAPSRTSGGQGLLAATTPSPTNDLNEVVIVLSTTVVVSNYDQYYAGDIRSFRPTYTALSDGSVVAPPLLAELRSVFTMILVLGGMLFMFARHTLTAARYIRTGKVKKKRLFYLLLCSQALGVVGLAPIAAATFDDSLSCSAVTIAASLAAATSVALLISGILGYKAYKCLSNSRVVLIVVALLQIASGVVTILDVVKVQGGRRLTGACSEPTEAGLLTVFFPLQLVEVLFIFGCFLYAVLKSHGNPAARGRMSVVLSLVGPSDDGRQEGNLEPTEAMPAVRRGWWDYVPDEGRRTEPVVSEPQRPFERVRSGLRHLWNKEKPSRSEGSPVPRKSSIHAELIPPPAPTQPRQSAVQIQDDPSVHMRHERPPRRSASPAPSTGSRLSKYFPRVPQLLEMLHDELRFTAFIAAVFVVLSVLTVIGVNFKTNLSILGWVALSWAAMSLLAMESFRRVVQRHERDYLLRQPLLWDPAARAEILAAEVSRRRRVGGPYHSSYSFMAPPQVRSRRTTNGTISTSLPNAPARDERGDSLSSWKSSPELYRVQTNQTAESGSIYSPSVRSFVPAVPRTGVAEPSILPSPDTDAFPTSGNTTPMPDTEKARIFFP